MHISGLRQVGQRATDVDRAVAFYRDVLGLRFIAQFGQLAFFDVGGTRILLEPGMPSTMLYLQVDDIHAASASLREKGVVFVDEPHVIFADDAGQFGPAGESEWMCFFKDSEDNTLGLAARAPSAQP